MAQSFPLHQSRRDLAQITRGAMPPTPAFIRVGELPAHASSNIEDCRAERHPPVENELLP